MKKEDYINYMNNIKPNDQCADDIYHRIISDSDVGKKKRIHQSLFRNPARAASMIAAAVLCVALVSGGGVYAFQHYVARYDNHESNWYNDHFAEITDANGNTYRYDNSLPIDKTSEFQNLSITCISSVYDEHNLYVKFHVETKDGSSLVTNSEDVISNYVEQRFGKVFVYVNGKKLKSARGVENKENKADRSNFRQEMQRVDNGENVDKAQFELFINDDSVSFTDKNVEILLSDYKDYQTVTKSIGFKYNSVVDFVSRDELADESEFYKLDPDVYNLGSIDALSAGDKKIYFAEEYPTAYIDNYGIKMDERYGHEAFYLTINPGVEDKAGLQKLVLQNTITGSIEETYYLNAQDFNDKSRGVFKLELPDGRIELIFMKRGEDGIKETTIEDLADYIMKYNMNDEVDRKPVIAHGSCRFDFNCKGEQADVKADYEIPATVIPSTLNDHKFTVTSIRIEAAKVSVNGTLDSTIDQKKAVAEKGVENNIYLILKDGTKLECKYSGAGGKTGGNELNIRWKLNTFIHPSDVVAIEWNGVRIDLSKEYMK